MERLYTPEEVKKAEKETAKWIEEENERRKNPLYIRRRRESSMVEEIMTGQQD